MDDLISRQAAIDIVRHECGEWKGLAKEIVKQFNGLPSAQPEPHESFTDLINRQMAIDEAYAVIVDDAVYDVVQVETLEALPSVDAVEVVRCKDCVNCEYDSIFNQYWCGGSEVISDGFCNYGEREDPLHGAMNPPEDDITDGKGEAK